MHSCRFSICTVTIWTRWSAQPLTPHSSASVSHSDRHISDSIQQAINLLWSDSIWYTFNQRALPERLKIWYIVRYQRCLKSYSKEYKRVILSSKREFNPKRSQFFSIRIYYNIFRLHSANILLNVPHKLTLNRTKGSEMACGRPSSTNGTQAKYN